MHQDEASRGAGPPPRVAVIGSGIAGLSCAWLLSRRCDVTLIEAEDRLGGHSNTIQIGRNGASLPVDTGFIVYNEANYPNLTALFDSLGVATKDAEMSFGVSLDEGALEYGSRHPLSVFAQPSNLFKPRFWSMLADLVRFYREAPKALAGGGGDLGALGAFLDAGRYGRAFQEDHLLPQVGAIWSATSAHARDYPAEALIRFFDNHGLLNLLKRPQWRTVDGGSQVYVNRLAESLAGRVRLSSPVAEVKRTAAGMAVRERSGRSATFDHVVVATHADQALRMLADPTPDERRLLGAFRYSTNLAVLHEDPGLMPRRRAAWSAWNHLGKRGDTGGFCVTYWMNQLQGLPAKRPIFVTLNPCRPVRPEAVLRSETYQHPLFDTAAVEAQRQLWSLQGQGGVWFCGAHFGAGFHEDGLQSGLAVAEALAPVRRPWTVAKESGRIHLTPLQHAASAPELAA